MDSMNWPLHTAHTLLTVYYNSLNPTVMNIIMLKCKCRFKSMMTLEIIVSAVVKQHYIIQ